MTAETTHSPQEWSAGSSVGGGPSFSAIVLAILFLAVVVAGGLLYATVFGEQGLPQVATTRAEAQVTAPPPTVPPAPAAVDPGDMNTLGPQFGEFLVKHPEYTDRIGALQGLMDANRRSVKSLCVSISAVCAHASGHDPGGVCKNRPPQCAQ